MKKIFAMIVGLVLILVLVSCAQPTVVPTPTPTPTSVPTQSTVPPPVPKPTTSTPSASPSSVIKPIELKFADFLPPVGIPVKDVAIPWSKKIEAQTNGRVKFTFYTAESLAKTSDLYDALKSKMTDIAHIDVGILSGTFPLSEGLALPLVFNTDEASCATYTAMVEKYLQDTELKSIKFLWSMNIPPSNIQTSKKQVKTLEDLKGMKIAVTSQMAVKIMGALGATPVVMPIVEQYTALERGMVDGGAEPWATSKTFKSIEVTKYRTVCNLWTSVTMVAMNLDTWNSLPSDIKEIINKNLGVEFSRTAGATFDAASKDIVDNYIAPYDREKGYPGLYDLPETEKARWVQAIQPVREQWIGEKESKGLPARAFVNDMLEVVKKYQK